MSDNIEQILDDIGVSGSNFFDFQDRTYFAGNDGEIGTELWVSDGTTEGTQLLLEINPTITEYYDNLPNGSYPGNFVEFQDKLYFSANNQENGTELWVTDGTSEGTELVVDINPGTYTNFFTGEVEGDGGFPTNIVEFKGKLYFSGNGEESGRELWVTDGTSEGTQLIKDINPGNIYVRTLQYGYIPLPIGSAPSQLTEFNDKLYFTAEVGGRQDLPSSEITGETGRELWVTDGTTAGTILVADINPGEEDAFDYGADLSVVDGDLLFTANNGETEQQYRITSDGTLELVNGSNPNEPNAIDGTLNNDVLTGTDGKDIIRGFDGTDTLQGGAGNDTLFGNNRPDKLVGGAGDDLLVGGSGDDSLDGGIGNDTLQGQGNDFFVLREGDGTDVILDYREGSDRLLLSGDLTKEDLTFSGNNILVGDETLVTLNNINTSSLRPFNFIEI